MNPDSVIRSVRRRANAAAALGRPRAIELARAIFTLLLVVPLAGGCSEEIVPQPIARMSDPALISRQPLVVGVNQRWEVPAGTNVVETRRAGRLWLQIGEETPDPLRIRFIARGSDPPFHARVRWDGDLLSPDPVTLDVISIPAAELRVGLHRLELERVARLDPPEVRRKPLAWRRLEIERGHDRIELDTKSFAAAAQVGEILHFGGTGADKARRRGWLFLGPGRSEVRLAEGHGEQRWFSLLENLGSGDALRVRIDTGGQEIGDFEIPAGSSRRVDLLLPPNAASLGIEVEGGEDLRLLVGEPYVTSPSADLPPIILITLDTTRRDMLTPYGAPPDRTPKLQELAETATVYDAAYATSPWTLPSHSSIFTGLLPSRHGAGVSEVALSPRVDTLAEALLREGYFNAGFAGGFLMSYRFGVGQGFHYYRDPDSFETPGDVLTGYVGDFLDVHPQDPLFLFVNLFDAHWKYLPRADLAERYRLDELARPLTSEPVWDLAFSGEEKAWDRIYRAEEEITAPARAWLRAAYGAELKEQDEHLGVLLDELRRRDLFDRALIVVVADHGELLGENGRFIGHGYRLDDEIIEIPLIVKWPGQKEGVRVPHMTSQIDLFPTILNLARGTDPAPAGEGMAAIDLRSLPRTSWILSEEHSAPVHPLEGNRLLAKHLFRIQDRDFAQIVWNDQVECRRRDGSEWRTVECPSDGGPARSQLDAWLEHVKRDDPTNLDSESAKALRALGYL